MESAQHFVEVRVRDTAHERQDGSLVVARTDDRRSKKTIGKNRLRSSQSVAGVSRLCRVYFTGCHASVLTAVRRRLSVCIALQ